MNNYTSNLTLPAAANRLVDDPGPALILTHAKPDGDALGSVLALLHTMRGLGRQAHGVLVPPVTHALGHLPGADLLDRYHDDYQLPFDPAQIIIVDTGAWSQVGPMRAFIEPRLDRTFIIDHHLSGDIPAKDRLIDAGAAACCEIIAEMVELMINPTQAPGKRETDAAGYKPLPPITRDALFVGVASDTGWFRFSNTRPQTHELAARLIRMGTDHAGLYQHLEQGERPEKLKLLCRAVSNLTLLTEHSAAVMVLRAKDFEETGALPEETERLVDIPQIVEQIQVVVLVTEHIVQDDQGPRSTTRMSFRSKPASTCAINGANNDHAINVADLAARFGGGGHARAAGAKVDRPVDEVLPEVFAVLRELPSTTIAAD